MILPAGNAVGSHRKDVGYDEIHGYRNWDIFEALAPDPMRLDSLTWITSYASIFNTAGAPLYDLMHQGKRREDPRMPQTTVPILSLPSSSPPSDAPTRKWTHGETPDT